MRAGPPRAVAGRITAPDGTDLKRCRVSLARDDGPPGERRVMWMTEWAYSASLDAEGRFRVPDLYDGTYAAFVDGAAGFASAVVRGVRPGDEDVELRLVAAREIAGVLVDADGRPVKGGVTLKPVGGFGPAGWAQSADDGRFRVTVPFEGDGIVEAWANDNAPVRTNVALPAIGELRIEVSPKR
jgi:hypothetical protein